MKTPTKPDDLIITSGGVVQGGGIMPNQPIQTLTSQIGTTITVQDKNRVFAQLQSLGAPMGVQIIENDTIDAIFAVNLQNINKPLLYINWTMCVETMNSTPTEMMIGLSHEMNHVWEEAWRRSIPEGEQQYQEYLAHLKSKGRLWRSYHTLYNCLRDVWVNDMTIRRFQGRKEELGVLYRYKLFQGNDFTHYPKHLQFCYTLLRESPLHVPDELCIIDPEVRQMIDIIKQSGVILPSTFAQATKIGSDNLNPYDNLGDRIQIIRQYIEPWFEELLNEDLEDQDNKDGGDNNNGN
ncbi:MAG TPA: hypothetical protein PK048_00525, partial [Candidatus Absconditabacterales bacterium]|nr:hypothetical protein [Candidatus Absconditabacterales bacterium]